MSDETESRDGWREAARRNALGWVEAEQRAKDLRDAIGSFLKEFDRCPKNDPLSSVTFDANQLAIAAGLRGG